MDLCCDWICFWISVDGGLEGAEYSLYFHPEGQFGFSPTKGRFIYQTLNSSTPSANPSPQPPFTNLTKQNNNNLQQAQNTPQQSYITLTINFYWMRLKLFHKSISPFQFWTFLSRHGKTLVTTIPIPYLFSSSLTLISYQQTEKKYRK